MLFTYTSEIREEKRAELIETRDFFAHIHNIIHAFEN